MMYGIYIHHIIYQIFTGYFVNFFYKNKNIDYFFNSSILTYIFIFSLLILVYEIIFNSPYIGVRLNFEKFERFRHGKNTLALTLPLVLPFFITFIVRNKKYLVGFIFIPLYIF